MPVQHYRELIAWQKAMDLAESIYQATREFPKEEQHWVNEPTKKGSDLDLK